MNMEFLDEMKAALAEVGEDTYNHYDFEGTIGQEVGLIARENLGERRWGHDQLDVYRRDADGALGGVLWYAPATEIQESQPTAASVVAVRSEVVTQTVWRVVP